MAKNVGVTFWYVCVCVCEYVGDCICSKKPLPILIYVAWQRLAKLLNIWPKHPKGHDHLPPPEAATA